MADDLSSSSCNLKNNSTFQLITCILLHDLSLLCSFIISYPLYFSYFIFFYPYIIKLISFISPMFVATVFLSLLLTSTTALFPKLQQLNLQILQSVIQELKSNLHDVNGDEDDRNFEDFEIYKIVFDGTLSIAICNEVSPTEMIIENSDTGGRRNEVTSNDSCTNTLLFEGIGVTSSDSVTDKLGVEKVPENSVHSSRRDEVKVTDSVPEKLGVEKILEHSVHGGRRNNVTVTDSVTEKLGVEKILTNSLHGGRRSNVTSSDSDVDDESARFEDFTTATETDTDSDKVTGVLQKAEEIKLSSGSEAISSSDDDKLSQNSVISSSLTSDGSMREEKEWRRTLACKLFEERHNSRGEEGMDSLWEAYENDNKSRLMMMKNYNSGGIRSFNGDVEEEDDEDEMEMSNGHLCCLQALKLSTGKMNLGMGKISKALKGFGWLHHAKNKRGKKR